MRDNLIADAINNGQNFESAGYILLIADSVSVLLYLLPAVVFSGAFRVVKNIAWADFLFFGSDFKDGVRLNFKIFSTTFLLIGTGIFVVDYAMLQNHAEILKAIPLGLSVLLLMPIAILVIVQGTIYNIGFFGAVKNAVFLFSKSVIPSVAASIATISPAIFILIPNTAVKHICLALYFVIVFPYVCLGSFMSGCAVLDKYHNSIYHPEIVGKGIASGEADVPQDDE